MELLVVMMVLSIVVALAGFSLISLSNTASRSDSMVQEEQTATSVLSQLARDIRSAVSITFPSGASPSTQLELKEVGTSLCSTSTTTTAGTSYTYVLWVVSSTTGTLTREQQNSSCAWVQSPFQLNYLVNSSSNPVFSYTDDQGDQLPIASPTPSTPLDSSWGPFIASQASAVAINLYVSTVVRGVATFHTTCTVALTNQLQTLNAAGEGT